MVRGSLEKLGKFFKNFSCVVNKCLYRFGFIAILSHDLTLFFGFLVEFDYEETWFNFALKRKRHHDVSPVLQLNLLKQIRNKKTKAA